MTFFIIKAADELISGDPQAAWNTLTSGAPITVQKVEEGVALAFQDFLSVFGAAEATTVLTGLSTALKSGIKSGEAVVLSGTVANAEAGASAAAAGVEAVLTNAPANINATAE